MKEELQICPVCQQHSLPVYVHGHYQCSICGINISPCCDGEQCVTENGANSKWQAASGIECAGSVNGFKETFATGV
jgi:hypothetical protein